MKLVRVQEIGFVIAFIGVIAQMIGVVVPLPSASDPTNPAWILTGLGAVAITLSRLADRTTADGGVAERKLATLLITSSIMLGIGAYLMYSHRNYWPIVVLMSAATEIYVSFRTKNKKKG